MSKRLNARLDGELADKIDYLQRASRKSLTEIVKESIVLYHRQFEEEADGARRILEDAGFVGCGEDDAALSVDYKKHLGRSVAAKTKRR